MADTTAFASIRAPRQGRWPALAMLALGSCLLLATSGCQRADAPGPASVLPAQGAASAAPGVLPTAAANDWSKLTPSQQQALEPLAAEWSKLSDGQRRKWISLSANYPQMTPAQQATLHERMVQWAKLSARQRALARLNYAQTRSLDAQTKTQQWQAYQALSPEEKHLLAKSAPPPPPRTALAAKPTPPEQLNHQLRLHTKVKPANRPASAPTPPDAVVPRPAIADITDEPGKP